jgi:hypothetical protein
VLERDAKETPPTLDAVALSNVLDERQCGAKLSCEKALSDLQRESVHFEARALTRGLPARCASVRRLQRARTSCECEETQHIARVVERALIFEQELERAHDFHTGGTLRGPCPFLLGEGNG